MSNSRKRLLGNFLIFGVSGTAALAILVVALVARPWAGDQASVTYWMLPIMLVGITAAHIGSRVKSSVKVRRELP